nr:vegetative cell wall protein gp1-like [Aegilops tauschii subsp. strangulata]
MGPRPELPRPRRTRTAPPEPLTVFPESPSPRRSLLHSVVAVVHDLLPAPHCHSPTSGVRARAPTPPLLLCRTCTTASATPTPPCRSWPCPVAAAVLPPPPLRPPTRVPLRPTPHGPVPRRASSPPSPPPVAAPLRRPRANGRTGATPRLRPPCPRLAALACPAVGALAASSRPAGECSLRPPIPLPHRRLDVAATPLAEPAPPVAPPAPCRPSTTTLSRDPARSYLDPAARGPHRRSPSPSSPNRRRPVVLFSTPSSPSSTTSSPRPTATPYIGGESPCPDSSSPPLSHVHHRVGHADAPVPLLALPHRGCGATATTTPASYPRPAPAGAPWPRASARLVSLPSPPPVAAPPRRPRANGRTGATPRLRPPCPRLAAPACPAVGALAASSRPAGECSLRCARTRWAEPA